MAVSTPASTRLATALGSTLCKPPHGQSLPDRGFPHACHLSRRKSRWIPVHSFGRRAEEAAGEVAGPQSVDGVSLHCRGTWPRSFPRGIEQGTVEGDPLNLVIVADLALIQECFGAWDETESLTLRTAWKTAKAFLLESRYRYSPVSPLYLGGRQQDLALQRARLKLNERPHMRLWTTSVR